MISEFRFVGSPAVTNSYYNAGNVEISLSDDVQGQVLVKFDNSLNFQYLDSIYRYDEIMNDNQLLLQINENGDMNARIYNNMNLYININFKIDGNELTMVYFNELLRTRPIMHILTGKKII